MPGYCPKCKKPVSIIMAGLKCTNKECVNYNQYVKKPLIYV